MDVWIRPTKKKTNCNYCNKTIELGEYQVVCRYYMQLKNSEKKWRKELHYHAKNPYCWVDRAVAELERKPKVENRGAVRMTITDENKEKRLKVLRKRAALMQRLKSEMEGEQRMDRLRKLAEKVEGCKEEIRQFGGVPKNW